MPEIISGPERVKRNIGWIECHCRVPEGRDVGKPIWLRPFQVEIMEGIYGSPTRRAIISVGRKNAKSALAAILAILHTCGPEARQNSELFSSALSRDQASLIFRLAAKIIRFSQKLRAAVTIRETVKQLHYARMNVLYSALSADASTSFGLSPVLVIHDELGQVRGPQHMLYESLETSTAAQEDPLSVIISTQAPNDEDLLSILIDDALEEHDPKTKLFLYTSDEDADPFAEETIRQANPAFGDFQNAEEVLAMAQDAKRMPSREAEYRNLILNQRVETASPFVTKTVWLSNGDNPLPAGPIYGGLDLSEVNDLTAYVEGSPMGGLLHVHPTFWLPGEGLAERARKDRVPYDLWAKDGFLRTTPGKSVEYEFVANFLARRILEKRVCQIAFDRYNMRHLRPWLLKAGLSEAKIDEIFVEFGQGFVSMGPALRVLESLLLNGKVRHGNHPVLTMCAANAIVKSDEAGNRKLDKKRSRGRIDGMVSLAMAAALANSDLMRDLVFPVPEENILEEV